MEREKILSIIKDLEEKNLELENYLSNLTILSRNDIIKKISQDIIQNNELLQEIVSSKEQLFSSRIKRPISPIQHIIEGFLSKIKSTPSKKVIYLREFLEIFKQEISEKDKDVILQSLQDEKNEEELKEKMITLATTFELKF
ncbi:MAG: hypothetical protein ACFE8L_05625 [Candidatus Hodarchaeota archaeon]